MWFLVPLCKTCLCIVAKLYLPEELENEICRDMWNIDFEKTEKRNKLRNKYKKRRRKGRL